jgi:nucleotide-binding universal stress UspA family protein
MSDHGSEPLSDALQRQRALSRWDNEGGAQTDGPQAAPHAVEGQLPFPKMGDAEFGALHVRVIALENLVIALLVAASDQELTVAREMVSYISPRLGFTHHPLTIHAAGHMTDLIERAARFRNKMS